MENKTQKMKKIIGLLILVALFGAVSYFALVYATRSTITVSGTYAQKELNQSATFNVYINFRNATKEAAVEQLRTETAKLTNEIKNAGIPNEDIKTTNFSVFQEEIWNQNTNRSEKGDWLASSNMEIKLEDGARATEIATLLSVSDVNSFDGPHFTLAEADVDEVLYLQKAYDDAYEKASRLAASQGRRIVKVLEIEEGVTNNGFMSYSRMEGMGGGGMALEPGSSEITRTILVKFEVR